MEFIPQTLATFPHSPPSPPESSKSRVYLLKVSKSSSVPGAGELPKELGEQWRGFASDLGVQNPLANAGDTGSSSAPG